jgi:hypothetical protein
VNVILTLARWGLPRALATWITKHYVVLSVPEVRLVCPYVLVNGFCYHEHCTPGGWVHHASRRYDKSKAVVALHEFIP